jgi:hypothetical protein
MKYRADKLRNYKITKLQNSSRGYILITMMLFITLLAIAALAVLPELSQQIKRDREDEMRHRGTQYMRAIQKYYKKFGRYPSRIEELENTNQFRFLRKRYKDPLFPDKDFKLVHAGDPALNMLGLGGVGQGLPQLPGQGGKPGAANAAQLTGLLQQQQQSVSTTTPPGDDSENSDAKADAKADAKSASSSSDSGSAPGGQVFGGGPILGVVSTSKQISVREFNRKNHYNDWIFIYDPSADRGGLLEGPVEPDLNKSQGIAPVPGAAPGPPNAGPSPVGQPPAPGPPATQEPPDEQ